MSRFVERPLTERVGIVRSEIDRVAGRLGGLTDGELDRPAIGDWTVKAVVAHLAVVPEFYTDSVIRGAVGDDSVAGDRPAAGTGRGEIAAGGILRRASEVAAEGDVRSRFVRSAHALADELDGAEAGLSYGCYHPGGVVPAHRFLVLFLKELGLHEWDIFEALSPPCEVSRWGVDAAIQAMEEDLASGSLRWVTAADPEPDAVTIRVSTTGTVPVERDLVMGPDGTRLVPIGGGGEPGGRLALDAADFVLGCSGRLDLAHAVRTGRAAGDIDVVEVLTRRLTGM